MVLPLVPTQDILAELGRRKRDQVLVGFAAETDDLVEGARHKLLAKNLDWIVANDVTRKGAGFDTDTNIVTIISRSGAVTELPVLSKREVAERILDDVLGNGASPRRRWLTPGRRQRVVTPLGRDPRVVVRLPPNHSADLDTNRQLAARVAQGH